jgi:hypothetical protein
LIPDPPGDFVDKIVFSELLNFFPNSYVRSGRLCGT